MGFNLGFKGLNVYGDDAGGGKLVFLRFHVLYLLKHAVIRTLHRPVLVSTVKPSHREASVIWKVFGILTTTFMNQ